MTLFSRSPDPLPAAVAADGAQIWDADGNRYLDGGSGALVVNIGHGNTAVRDAVARQLTRVPYVHATKFTTDALIEYTHRLAPLLPVDDAHVYPVSGGGEAVETALKLARAYHLARGEDRDIVISRQGSYHGNVRGALAVSGRPGLRRPYEPWLDHTVFVPAAYEYRCEFPQHPHGCAMAHAQALHEAVETAGPERVAAFIAEPVSGASLGACVPPAAYWHLMSRVCDRYGILLIIDEVLTGFGRTGRWFASDHFGLRADIVVIGKGAASGYWPLGAAACSRQVHETVGGAAFTHGFTFSHHPAGAAAGLAVLDVMHAEGLVEAAEVNGRILGSELIGRLGDHPFVGDIRGVGMLWAIELVADRTDRAPFPRSSRVVERVVHTARHNGLATYSSTGCADGTNGDLIVLGPPLCSTPAEVGEIADITATAITDSLPESGRRRRRPE